MQSETTNPDPVPWTARDVWQGLILIIVLLIIFAPLAYGLVQLQGMDAGSIVALTELSLLVPVWILAVRKYGAGPGDFGLRRFKSADFAVGCGLVILSYSFNVCYAVLLAPFNLRIQADMSPLLASLPSPWMFFVGAVIIGPVVEELFFRGFVFAGLRTGYGWKKAAVISAAVFAAFHLQLTFLIPGFILGYIFAYLYQRSHSIWPGILMHGSINTLGVLVSFLAAKMS